MFFDPKIFFNSKNFFDPKIFFQSQKIKSVISEFLIEQSMSEISEFWIQIEVFLRANTILLISNLFHFLPENLYKLGVIRQRNPSSSYPNVVNSSGPGEVSFTPKQGRNATNFLSTLDELQLLQQM